MTQGPLPPEPPPEETPPPPPPPTGPAPEPTTPPVLEPPVPTVPGDPTPQASPPPAAAPPPPPRSGMSGCAKAAIIGGIVAFVGLIAVLATVFFGVKGFVENIDADLGSPDSCQFLTDDEASDALGVTVTVESGESALGSILGIIRDTRLLSDEPFCFVSSEDSTTQAWVSVYEGGDAAGVFVNAADIADGEVVSSSSDASGSVSVETDPFRGGDVPGLGEEAFCVDAGAAVSGGVLARSGNRVVYVSVLPLVDDQGGADISSMCGRATSLARAVLE